MSVRTKPANAETAATPVAALSAAEARAIALRAQGLAGGRGAPRTPSDVLARLGAVQLDTISVLARSHELVAYARLGAVPRASIERAYWGPGPRAFEYWGHAACVLPIASWPYFAFRRRAMQRRWSDTSGPAFDEVRAHLRAGPVTVSDAGGARDGAAGWWNWSNAKRALEVLWRTGEAVVTTRSGWKRVYDLPERAIPEALRAVEPDDAACYRYLAAQAARALGVATVRDIQGYFMLATTYAGAAPGARALIADAIEQAGLVPVTVEGWADVAYVDPSHLKQRRADHVAPVLLSPFDSLIWASNADAGAMRNGRGRIKRLFDFFYAFEAYKRPEDRTHGYFTMPLLADGRMIGRVDPAREGRTLVARYASLEHVGDESVAGLTSALWSAARWVGCDDVRVDRTEPAGLSQRLKKALRDGPMDPHR